jgi:hypothetical protein
VKGFFKGIWAKFPKYSDLQKKNDWSFWAKILTIITVKHHIQLH